MTANLTRVQPEGARSRPPAATGAASERIIHLEPRVSLALGLEIAGTVLQCDDRTAAMRAIVQIVGREHGIPVAAWVSGRDQRLNLVAVEAVTPSVGRRLHVAAEAWELGADRVGRIHELGELFSSLAGTAAVTALDVGHGALLLGARCDEMERCAHELAGLLSWLPETATSIHARRSSEELDGLKLEQLSPREHEVLGMLTDGANTQQIADDLGISAKTVKTHVQNIFAKLGVGTRLEAVALATRARSAASRRAS